MKKKEMREMIITYCDYCGKELTHTNHTVVQIKDGTDKDFCSTYTDTIDKTCFDKYKEDQLNAFKETVTDKQ